MKYVYQSFFYYIFYLLQPCYRNLMYHIYFAVFCCWGEVVVPSDDLSEERINKTAKHWTIIMMRVEPKHNPEQSSATCSSVKNSKYLFCSCFTVAGYFLISFSFTVRSYTCLFSFSNKLSLKVSRCTCRYWFNFYLHYLIITISFIQYVFIDTHVLLELAFFLE